MTPIRRFVFATISIALITVSPLRSIDANAEAAEGDLLDRPLNAPYASDMTAAPTGSRVALNLNERGRRNVWTANAAGGAATKRTDRRDDDGQELCDLQWSADGTTIVYVRGDEGHNCLRDATWRRPFGEMAAFFEARIPASTRVVVVAADAGRA